MSPTLARCFVAGFGLELGAFIGLNLWPEIEYTAIPLMFIGAGLMTYATLFRK